MNNLPTVTKNLLIINVLCFFGMLVAKRYGIDVENLLGLHFFLASDFNLSQLISYMFMHANFQHIFFNMFAVWMFGRVLEQVWGPRRFLTYYLICGIGAGLIQELVQYLEYAFTLSNYDSVNLGIAGGIIPMEEYLNMMTTVGASGAVYGILLAFGMLFPNSQMFIFPLPFPIKAKYFVIGYAVLELFLGLGGGDGVAHFAHLGGMLFGLILIIYWRKKNGNQKNQNYGRPDPEQSVQTGGRDDTEASGTGGRYAGNHVRCVRCRTGSTAGGHVKTNRCDRCRR